MMRRVVVCVACMLLGGAWALAAGRTEVTVSFRQGFNHYEGCVLAEHWNADVRKASHVIDGRTLTFRGIHLPGNEVRVESAELRMTFAEEGRSHIRNADLELHDGADKEGKALSAVQYRNAKLIGMDPKTRTVTWSVPAALVQRWIDEPDTNKGLTFKVVPMEKVIHEFIFCMHTNKDASRRPVLVVRYSFTGEVAPFAPEITTHVDGKTFGPVFALAWRAKQWDLNGTPVAYEVAVAPEGGAFRTVGKAPADALSFSLDTRSLDPANTYQVRLRAVDPTGLTSDWVAADGAFHVSRETYDVWTQDAATKVQREEVPPKTRTPVTLAAARNEYESFQVVVTALSSLKDVDVAVGDLTGPDGAKIAKNAFNLFRVHYVDCKGQGWLPDSMVPWYDPWSRKRIGGKFGAPFDVDSGTNGLVWVELHVPEDARPGKYTGSVDVTVDGKPAQTIPVSLTVWDVTLPKTTTLLTYFELSRDTPARHYLQLLHKHRIDVWRVANRSHRLTWVDGKPVVQWSAEYDGALDDYFSGRMFGDGVPGKRYLLGLPSWNIRQALRGNNDANRIAILKQYEEHYKNKPYVEKLRWFFIDEPGPRGLAKCVRVGKEIKQYSPSIKFLLTTRYNKDLVGLVDVWDAIVNVQVINPGAPGPDPYRDEVKKGREVISCVTCNCNTPTSPNLFIHYKAMNTRIWPWVTYCLGLQGIEFWNTAGAPSVTVPKHFGPVWGDGSLTYRGLKSELGIVEDEIALPSVRLKILRDGIEDFELLSMLRKKDPALAMKLCHRMVQETKDYDNSFAEPVQQENYKRNPDGKGRHKVSSYIVWESSAKRLFETRAAIAAALCAGK